MGIRKILVPTTRDDLGNLVYNEVASEVCHCLVQVALEVQVLGKIEANLLLS